MLNISVALSACFENIM